MHYSASITTQTQRHWLLQAAVNLVACGSGPYWPVRVSAMARGVLLLEPTVPYSGDNGTNSEIYVPSQKFLRFSQLKTLQIGIGGTAIGTYISKALYKL